MNYILQLTGFFQRVAADNRLNPTHVSLYMAIFQFWNAGHFQNPISISRQELMRFSKISAKATYHKCIKDLHNFGYIQYLPSFNPFKGSLVYLFDLQSGTRLVPTPDRTNIETSIEQALVPYINKENILNENKENGTSSINDIVVKVSKNKAVVIEANGKPVSPKAAEEQQPKATKSKGTDIPPAMEDVLGYFAGQKSTETEANKFFNYFQSNGWKIGGKAPMRDWQAAARNWLLNAAQFSATPTTKQVQNIPGVKSGIPKNYSEPL